MRLIVDDLMLELMGPEVNMNPEALNRVLMLVSRLRRIESEHSNLSQSLHTISHVANKALKRTNPLLTSTVAAAIIESSGGQADEQQQSTVQVGSQGVGLESP